MLFNQEYEDIKRNNIHFLYVSVFLTPWSLEYCYKATVEKLKTNQIANIIIRKLYRVGNKKVVRQKTWYCRAIKCHWNFKNTELSLSFYVNSQCLKRLSAEFLIMHSSNITFLKKVHTFYLKIHTQEIVFLTENIRAVEF